MSGEPRARVTDERLAELEKIARQATPGPWCIESCGEKGDGSNMIGVAFGPKDMNAEHPLSGWLEACDDEGNFIEYYQDELVAECEHRNRNSGSDAWHIATFNPVTVLELIGEVLAERTAHRETEAKLREALAEVERLKAESIRRGRLLLKFRDELLGIAERIDATEDDRSYFGSTNDADRLKEVAESLDAFKWDLIMAEKSQPCIFETNKKNIARATAAESALAATKAKLEAAPEVAWKAIDPSLEGVARDCAEKVRAALIALTTQGDTDVR